jgi:type II secretory pathway pseudopilin PulG
MQRPANSGFILFDALIAFAMVALALTVLLVTLPRQSLREIDRIQRHEAAEFAFSKLEEYRVTFPEMQSTGTEPSGWAWSIIERPVPAEDPTGLIRLVKLDVAAWHQDRPDLRAAIQGVIARRAGG